MVLQKQFCTILMLQKHVSESVLCKTELVYTQKKQTGRMGSYIVVHARRAGRHLEISHSSEQAWFQFGRRFILGCVESDLIPCKICVYKDRNI